MKWLIAIAAATVVFAAAVAQQMDAFGNWVYLGYFNTVTNSTPTAVVTNNTAGSIYHTFHFVATNQATYSLQRSIDRTNWYVGATNALTPNVVTEATVTGKYSYFRILIQGTNVGLNVNYFGGK